MSAILQFLESMGYLQEAEQQTEPAAPDNSQASSTSAAPGAPGGGAGGDTPAPAPGGSDALASTSTDIFFSKNSADLTDSAKKSLDDYAKAYLGAKSAEAIVVDGYASTEGDDANNKKLSKQRAEAVSGYLKKKGLSKVSATGHGATDSFSKDDLAQNRRATIKPPPPKSKLMDMRPDEPATGEQGQSDQGAGNEGSGNQGSGSQGSGSQGSGSQGPDQAPKPIPRLTQDDYEKIVGPESNTVKRAKVEEELKKFLEELGKSQGRTDGTVRCTDQVAYAEEVLQEGNGSAALFTKPGGDGKDYEAAVLARNIAQRLPDEIPRANFDKFLKLKPKDMAKRGSVTDQLHEKYKAARDGIVDKLPVPQKLKDLAKKGMDAAVEKGVSYVVDQALKDAGVPEAMQEEMKKLVDEQIKKVVEGEKKK